MSFNFDKDATDNFTTEDFLLLRLMEEIAEIEQEIKLKTKSMENRVDLVTRILRSRNKGGQKLHEMIENEPLRKAIESFLLKIKADNVIPLGYIDGFVQPAPNEEDAGEQENKDEEAKE
eukprot:CAMPEP_0197008338 /NCGR_PEP_ID=MMETSP1380-20130617/44860_1 /TAXON_ID=5936 /ORGANISM="Euplotes crassus, Strain CT5" /LENGTH=118 /DNA_ID=CAMNT_0042428893 /DNA_START=3 /DNA_END=359 /DNA_ORIENTATION=+